MSFGEDSFHSFLLWWIFFNFAKCFWERFGNVAQLWFFNIEEWGKSAIFSKIKENLKRKSVLSESNFFLIWKMKNLFFFSSVVSTYFLSKNLPNVPPHKNWKTALFATQILLLKPDSRRWRCPCPCWPQWTSTHQHTIYWMPIITQF